MKSFLTFLAGFVVATILAAACISSMMDRYENYIHTSEELLWELEEMCDYHELDWGDTVCEGENWCNYCDAREELGLDYLEHYSKVK